MFARGCGGGGGGRGPNHTTVKKHGTLPYICSMYLPLTKYITVPSNGVQEYYPNHEGICSPILWILTFLAKFSEVWDVMVGVCVCVCGCAIPTAMKLAALSVGGL